MRPIDAEPVVKWLEGVAENAVEQQRVALEYAVKIIREAPTLAEKPTKREGENLTIDTTVKVLSNERACVVRNTEECTIKPDLCVPKIEDGKVVNILGTPYKIVVKAYEQDPDFERNGSGAYCDNDALLLVLCDMNTYPGWENGDYEDSARHQMKLLLRHEIVHAFLFQSGLSSNSGLAEEWATNEEMVDWIALQGPKIYKAFGEAGAL